MTTQYTQAHKISIVENLVYSAILLLNRIYHADNLKIIKEYLILNNSPVKFIEKYINKRTIESRNKGIEEINVMNSDIDTKKK